MATLPPNLAKAVGSKPTAQVSEHPDLGRALHLPADIRILLEGDTGSGKTTQLGELSEYIFATEDKGTVLFTGDKGGIEPIRPHVNMSIIEVVELDVVTDPWIWIQHALKGEAKVNGKWVQVTKGKGLAAYEGVTAFSELMLMNLAEHSAAHPEQAVGGDSAWSFEAKDGDEVLKISSNTMSHYGLVQMRLMHEIWQANPRVPSIWTAILNRVNDSLGTASGIYGPQAVGKQLTHSIPRWFDYTFRLNNIPTTEGMRYVLELATHLEKGARVLANARLPLAGSETVPVDLKIEPANLVWALLQITKRRAAAEGSMQTRIAKIRGMKK